MAGLSGEISAGSIMNKTAQRIFEKKSERRRELAALPFAKKIEIVEQLRELGRATKKFRTRARGAVR
jgi:septation ring formation regulator EzrA